jgi:hypothetical protein
MAALLLCPVIGTAPPLVQPAGSVYILGFREVEGVAAAAAAVWIGHGSPKRSAGKRKRKAGRRSGERWKRGGSAAVAVVDEMILYALAGSVPAFALFPKKN